MLAKRRLDELPADIRAKFIPGLDLEIKLSSPVTILLIARLEQAQDDQSQIEALKSQLVKSQRIQAKTCDLFHAKYYAERQEVIKDRAYSLAVIAVVVANQMASVVLHLLGVMQ